jgi:hypothetical protein
MQANTTQHTKHKTHNNQHELPVRIDSWASWGIQPCECKGKGYQWVGNQVFRLGLRQESIKSIKWGLCPRELRKPLGEFKNRNSSLLTKYCSQTKRYPRRNILTSLPPYPPAALPFPSMAMDRSAVLKTHGVMSSYGPMLGASGQVSRHGSWFLSLKGAKQHTSKNREMDDHWPYVATVWI